MPDDRFKKLLNGILPQFIPVHTAEKSYQSTAQGVKDTTPPNLNAPQTKDLKQSAE